MARLIYSTSASLDGYVNDRDGRFDFSEPSAELHAYINDQLRPIGTHLYGRRLYEVMSVWESMDVEGDPVMADFAQYWLAADKVVYSTTVDGVSTSRTRIERTFDPAAVRQLKDDAASDLLIGGPGLAAHAFRAGLVDEVHLYLCPVILGGGTRALPDDVRLDLELFTERRFSPGVMHVGYRVAEGSAA